MINPTGKPQTNGCQELESIVYWNDGTMEKSLKKSLSKRVCLYLLQYWALPFQDADFSWTVHDLRLLECVKKPKMRRS